jgi:carbamoyltransferase
MRRPGCSINVAFSIIATSPAGFETLLILSINHGPHDSAAALFDDYRLLAAVSEERLNRVKCSGGFPEKAVAEVLRIGGAEERDVDVLVATRNFFLRRYFTHWKLREKLRENIRRGLGVEKTRCMSTVLAKDPNRSAYDIFDTAAYLADLGATTGYPVFLLKSPLQPCPPGAVFHRVG